MRGIGLGRGTLGQLAMRGVYVTGYRWVYAPQISRHVPFLPHRMLAGQYVPVDQWPPQSEEWPYDLEPGDHYGCLCYAREILRGPDGRFLKTSTTIGEVT